MNTIIHTGLLDYYTHLSCWDSGDALFQIEKLFSGLIEKRLIIGCVRGAPRLRNMPDSKRERVERTDLKPITGFYIRESR